MLLVGRLLTNNVILMVHRHSTWKLDNKIDTNTHFLRVQPSFTKLAKNVGQLVKFMQESDKADINSYISSTQLLSMEKVVQL